MRFNLLSKIGAAFGAIAVSAAIAWAAQVINDDTTFASNVTFSTGTVTLGSGLTAVTANKAITPAAGVGVANSTLAYNASGLATCTAPAITTTQGTDTTPVNTETYVAEINVPANTVITGIAILNGSAVAGNATVYLMSADGTVKLANSASTAQSGTAAFQRIPFTASYTALGPGGYWIAVQFDTNTTPRFRTHTFGNCDAGKITSTVYGTFASFTPPTTFAASLGPVAGFY